MMKVFVKEKQRVLDDFFKVDRAVIQYEKFDGSISREIIRLNFDRGDSAAALLVNNDEEKLILVKQFRYPIYTKDKNKAWALEIVAGTVEKKSNPKDTIIREIQEETGYLVDSVSQIFSFYPSPGGSNEKIYIYYAEVTHKNRVESGGGVISEGEDIQVLEIPFHQAFQMVESGEIVDAKTIIAIQWFKARIQD